MIQTRFQKRIFQFKNPSGTSRGVLIQKLAWFIEIFDSSQKELIGIGECSVIPGLSPDYKEEQSYENSIEEALVFLRKNFSNPLLSEKLNQFLIQKPSILFGIETALLSLKMGGKQILIPSKFTEGKTKIPINGLIWMGNEIEMRQQIEEKLQQGFNCLKLKIGAIDFDAEIKLLTEIRKNHSKKELTIRVDANGAFSVSEALQKLEKLALLDLHSIEQPIQAGNWKEMAQFCKESPLPIALDEELIGIQELAQKIDLLDQIKPQFIILKPSLHGGFAGCREWISLADQRQTPWWITSALESNVGLNAIAQFTASYQNTLHQGLGTGALYVENTPSNLYIEKGFLGYSQL